MRKSRRRELTLQFQHKRTAESISLGTGAVPDDLAHPPDPGRASFIVNVAAGGVMLLVVLATLAYALLVVPW